MIWFTKAKFENHYRTVNTDDLIHESEWDLIDFQHACLLCFVFVQMLIFCESYTVRTDRQKEIRRD